MSSHLYRPISRQQPAAGAAVIQREYEPCAYGGRVGLWEDHPLLRVLGLQEEFEEGVSATGRRLLCCGRAAHQMPHMPVRFPDQSLL